MANTLKRFINSLRKEQCQTTIGENEVKNEPLLDKLIEQQETARQALLHKLKAAKIDELSFHPSELNIHLTHSQAASYRVSDAVRIGKGPESISTGRFIKLDAGNEIHRAIADYASLANDPHARNPIINKCVVIPKDTIKKMKVCNLREMADHLKFVDVIKTYCKNTSNVSHRLVKYIHFIRITYGDDMGRYRIYLDEMLIVDDASDADIVLDTTYTHRNDTDEFRSIVKGGRHIVAGIECGGRFDVERIIDGNNYRVFKKREMLIINGYEAIWGPVATTTI